jgi:tRNA(fMet)-specific endonuclease VapC
MIVLPDTNTCISLLRRKQPRVMARWQSTRRTDIVLCSVVVYELRHGAESSSDPRREHAKLDEFLAPFSSLPFDDACAATCAVIRRALERRGW